MARLITSGFETNRVGTVNTEPDGRFNAGGTAATINTTSPRTGTYLARCASGSNFTCFTQWVFTPLANTSYFLRAYLRFTNLPVGNDISVLTLGSGSNGASIKLTTTGDVQLWDDRNGVKIGTDLNGAVTADGTTWYRFEVMVTLGGTSLTTTVEGRVNGTTIATSSSLGGGGSGTPGVFSAGWVNTAPGTSKTVDVDDVALNDSTGANQNTWPGDGRVVMLKPTADSAVGTGWVRGNNTAISGGNGFQSVDNTPPVGIADLGGAGADTGQLRNATAAANSNYDATMQTYTAAGVPSGATVNVVDPIICTAAPVTTAAKAGQVEVVSNPAIAAIALGAGGTAGAFWSGVAGATYPTGWKWSHGTITHAPSVTLGTAPVMRVQQVTSSTRIAVVCAMGMYVDYTVPPIVKAGFGKESG